MENLMRYFLLHILKKVSDIANLRSYDIGFKFFLIFFCLFRLFNP